MADEHGRPSSLSGQPTRPPLTKHALAARHGLNSAVPDPSRSHMQSGSLPFSSPDSASGSSSSKPLFSFRDVTSPSSLSKTQSPDTELETPPKHVQTPRHAYFHPQPDPSSHTSTSPQSGDLSEPSQCQESTPSGASESEDYGGPTRASIRAWAKATPAGPPTGPSVRTSPDLPSSRSSPELPQSASNEDLNQADLTQAVRDLSISAVGSLPGTSSQSGHTSSRMSLDREESSGNVADGESSGSENSPSPPTDSPPPDDLELAAQRELSAPHPHPSSLPSHPKPSAHAYVHPQTPRARQAPLAHTQAHAHTSTLSHPHPHVHPRSSPHLRSSPESSPPAWVALPPPLSAPPPAHPDQQERVERRHHHHRHRRRHRDRERDRDRDRGERRARHAAGSAHCVVSVPALPPLRPLLPPPPPLPSLRTFPVAHSPGSHGTPGRGPLGADDIFGEIEWMLRTARQPVLRQSRRAAAAAAADSDGSETGWLPFARGAPDEKKSSGSRGSRRENDVLDDIRKMIHWSSRGRS